MKNIKVLKTLCALLILIVLTQLNVHGQGVTIGSNNPPDSSAILELQDTTKGFLLTRLTNAQRNAIQNPAVGLQIYNLTTNCIQVYMPQSGWRDVVCDCQSAPSSAFTFPDTASLNQAVIFTATTQGMIYSWTFQSGNPSTSSQQSDTVTWSVTGFYTISLSVTDNLGCSSTTTDSIYIDSCSTIVGNNTITFNYTGAVQTWTVPQGVCTIQIECWGAQGGTNGGLGGYAKGDLSVIPGQVLYIYVGGQGGSSAPGGWNGGGNSNGSTYGGSGGGASDIRVLGQSLNNRVIVAGGGGGGTNGSTPTSGGAGGGTIGATGQSGGGFNGGAGGTQSSGGLAGCCYSGTQNGTFGVGGGNGSYHNAGGGGGWYGGGSGAAHAGAGGGSGYIGGVTNGSMQTGIRSGNGQIKIIY